MTRPFDLERGPLLRGALLRTGDAHHQLLLAFHHIVFDGWSVGVLESELTALYEAYTRDAAPTLPAPTLQYADFAAWQREWLTGPALESQLAYWTKQLEGPLPRSRSPARVLPGPRVGGERGVARAASLPCSPARSRA